MFKNNKGRVAIVAAIVVLFSAMVDPAVSVAIAVVTLLAIGFWEIRAGKPALETCLPDEKQQRKSKILELLENKGKITNDDVQKLLGASDATATRYLDELEKEGKIKQVGKTGGYVYYEKI